VSALARPAATLRPMTVADLDAVMAVESSAYSFPWTRGNFIDSLAAGYLALVLASREDGIVGYLVAMRGVDEMHLLNVTVAPAWQRRGLGHELLDALVAHCRAEALSMLWLEVRQSNERARALYARRGFTEVGLRRGYYPAPLSKREDAVVMSLRVLPEAGRAVE
jgi:[ribosomal protein S18]-alanine N-acetyltransferase